MSNDATTATEWPAHFPASCPPESAGDAAGSVYRFVKTDPATAKDMLSWLELGLGKNKPPCGRAALSCYLDIEHLKEIREVTPRRHEDKIAEARLSAADGKMGAAAPDSHVNVWLCKVSHANALTLFRVVA